MESSFPVYLSSNACPDIYPNNTPSDFRTRLSRPIELRGPWEVGIASISYSSHIEDKEERAFIDLLAESTQVKEVNELYAYKFALHSNGSWIGFEGSLPKSYETDASRVEVIVKSLNDMNGSILQKDIEPIYTFNIEHGNSDEDLRVVYTSKDPNFSLRLTSRLAQVLGFGERSLFQGSDTVKASAPPPEWLTKKKAKKRAEALRQAAAAAAAKRERKAESEVKKEAEPKATTGGVKKAKKRKD